MKTDDLTPHITCYSRLFPDDADDDADDDHDADDGLRFLFAMSYTPDIIYPTDV